MVVGHVTPEAFDGGTIALVQEGDLITIDSVSRSLHLHVADDELSRRRTTWKRPKRQPTRGVLAKFARNVSDASTGAVLDMWKAEE